jgi:two-component system NtrC family response regulator
LVAAGRFRQDLMYRLSVLVIPLAPLRERRDDIPLLARHFLDTLAKERSQETKSLSAEALNQLMNHGWPGNVRELRHAMEFAVALSLGKQIEVKDLPEKIQSVGKAKNYVLNLAGREQVDLRATTDEFERDIIMWALQKVDGNQGKAAQLLGIPRSTLQFKLQQKS